MGNKATRELSGSVTTRKLDDTTVETIYRGKITADMAMQVRREIEPFLRQMDRMDWLIDASLATGITPAPREASTGVITLFRKHNGGRIACVMPQAAIRMVASALAFGTGVPMRMFASREEALDYLHG